MEWVENTNRPPSRYILLAIGQVYDRYDYPIENEEAYSINVVKNTEIIFIVGNTIAGVLNGAQSMMSLFDNGPLIQEILVTDFPRFGYRGRP